MELCISLKRNGETDIMFAGKLLTLMMMEQQNSVCLKSGTINAYTFIFFTVQKLE